MRGEKTVVGLSLVFVIFLFILLLFARSAYGVDLPGCVTDVKPYRKGALEQITANRYQLRYVAKMWTFDPPEVRIPAGSEVDLYLVTQDVVHGLQIPGTNVNLMAVPGAIAYTKVKFTKPGTYYVRCHEFCGAGHQFMEARIIVEESPSSTKQ